MVLQIQQLNKKCDGFGGPTTQSGLNTDVMVLQIQQLNKKWDGFGVPSTQTVIKKVKVGIITHIGGFVNPWLPCCLLEMDIMMY
jgi:hypothetical protein